MSDPGRRERTRLGRYVCRIVWGPTQLALLR